MFKLTQCLGTGGHESRCSDSWFVGLTNRCLNNYNLLYSYKKYLFHRIWSLKSNKFVNLNWKWPIVYSCHFLIFGVGGAHNWTQFQFQAISLHGVKFNSTQTNGEECKALPVRSFIDRSRCHSEKPVWKETETVRSAGATKRGVSRVRGSLGPIGLGRRRR